jgi:hypothetical protein
VTDTRLTLRQAAAVLGVSESAIRKRVERGTLRSDKGPDGRRYVYVDTVADERADKSATPERDALMSELRTHNDTLREQLEAERQAHAEARRIIAGLVERVPQLPPAEGPPEGPEQGEHAGDRGDAPAVRDSDRRQRKRQALPVLALALSFLLLGLVLLSLAASGESLAGISASVRDAFATVLSSGLSSVTGDQAAIIVSSIITVLGPIIAAYLGIRWQRRGGN